MSTSHVNFNDGDFILTRKVREMVAAGRLFRDRLRELTAVGNTMIDGSDYSMLEAQFRCQAGAGQTLIGEMNSVLSKLDTDASVTNVLAAIDQLFAKLG